MAKVYVVLSYPDTIPSKGIKLFTRKPYSHTSISFDQSLDVLYTFGRKSLYNIVSAGFIHEHIGERILGRRNTRCMVCAIEVTPEQKEIMRQTVAEIDEHRDDYKYNFAGLFANIFHKYPVYEKKFICSQFVEYVLESGGVNILGKSYLEARPEDFRVNTLKEVVYEGGMNDYPYRKLPKEDGAVAV